MQKRLGRSGGVLSGALALVLMACGGGGGGGGSAAPAPDAGSSPPPAVTPTPNPPAGGTATPAPGSSASPPAQGAVLAFPGAEGFGAFASGGRGGRVLKVSNLAAAGPGSLQAALDESGPRTIVFEVSGLIDAPVRLTNGDVTLAGQTSPGGITVRGFVIEGDVVCEDDSDACLPRVAPRNFIVRFMRSRNPAEAVDPRALAGGDAFRLHRAQNGILDHVSAGNAYDEAFQISLSSDITIQYALLAETLGEHADLGGMLINYSDPTRGYALTRLSLHHNMWNRISGRLPEFSQENFPSSRGSVMDVEFSYNLIFDPSFPMWLGLSCDPGGSNPQACAAEYRMNLVGNLFMARSPRFNHGMLTLEGALAPQDGYLSADRATRLFMQGNRVDLFAGLADFQLIYCCNDFAEASAGGSLPFGDSAVAPVFAATARHAFPAISATASESLADHLAAQAGSFPRDPMDTRLMAAVQQRSFASAPVNTNPAGDSLATAAAAAVPADGDGDGMPDAWEQAHGLDPLQPSHAGLELAARADNGIAGCSAGYTNLECYLNELAAQRVAGQ